MALITTVLAVGTAIIASVFSVWMIKELFVKH